MELRSGRSFQVLSERNGRLEKHRAAQLRRRSGRAWQQGVAGALLRLVGIETPRPPF
jgi:hypothetical protein